MQLSQICGIEIDNFSDLVQLKDEVYEWLLYIDEQSGKNKKSEEILAFFNSLEMLSSNNDLNPDQTVISDIIAGKTLEEIEVGFNSIFSIKMLAKIIYPAIQYSVLEIDGVYGIDNSGEMKYSPFFINNEGQITGYLGEVPANLTIPATVRGTTVTGIVANVFKGNTSIKSLTVEDLAQFSIMESAFEGCTNLESITFNASSYYLAANSFKKCEKLSNIYFYIKTTPNLSNTAFSECTASKTVRGTIDQSYSQYTQEQLEYHLSTVLTNFTIVWE